MCIKIWRVALRGRVASLLEVGTGFHPELTGRDNIFLNGAILGMRRAEIRRKFDEIVAFAEVEKFIDTPVKRYSSGMYVRLAFAVAAHLEPEILIVDEVLAVGDAEFQQKCLGKMQSIAERQGRTILFVSHNLKAVEHFCRRGLLLEQGHLLRDDSAHAAVSAYLARGSVQLGRGTVKALGEELELIQLEFSSGAVPARGSIGFSVELAAKQACQIHDLHLFAQNSSEDRAGIIDLRDASTPGGSRSVQAGRRVQFAGRLDRVALVEGRYRVGLCVRTSRDFRVLYDLVDLEVTAVGPRGNLMPYAPEYQGTTNLDYEFTVRIT